MTGPFPSGPRREADLRTFRWFLPWMGFLLAVCGCGGAEAGGDAGDDAGVGPCEDRLEVSLNVWTPGDYSLDGTADGVPFHCSFWLRIDGWGENPEDYHFGGSCSGPATLIESDEVLVLAGAPASVPWTSTWTDALGLSHQDTRSGRLEPLYRDEGGCRIGEASLSP